MNKYRILWLDDDFLPLIQDPSSDQEDINKTRRTFLRDVNKASKYQIDVDGVPSLNPFLEKLKNNHYQAVVFDLMGLDNQNIDNIYVIKEALDSISGHQLLAYVYSNNSNADIFDITLKDIKDNGRCFDKGLGCKPLFEKIVADLKQDLNVYENHEECLLLLNHHFISPELRPYMDDILKSYNQQKKGCVPLNSMRQILENMLQSLVDRGDIKDSVHSFSDRIRYVAELCEKKKGKVDYDSPLFPYSKCRAEVKLLLSFLGNMTQEGSHFMTNKKQDPEYLLPGEALQDFNRPIVECAYLAFFVVMKWFYGYILNDGKQE